ncbi:MAG: branched-chain-amino-acid transaminase [Fimbriimonadaceae bacterium]|nr:branched-chain-amino-acid transaminase [Fimbriimonadaceae bacterium]
MPKLVWFNGEISSLENATVPAADHAHLYGDGLFEGIRIYGRKVFKLDQHLRRLYDGCRFLGIPMKWSEPELKRILLDTCMKADIEDGYIRLNVTRGTGLGLDPRAVKTDANVMIMINTLALYTPEMYEAGLDVVTTSFRVIPADALDPRLKCIGRYASNIMAKREANMKDAGEGLMLNGAGMVAECTGDNIFIIRDGVLRTPHPSAGILQGITRDSVIEMAKEDGIPVKEDFFTIYDITSADEAFLTGTAAEVIRMRSLDGRIIGDGDMGPITRRLTERFRLATQQGTPFTPTTV